MSETRAPGEPSTGQSRRRAAIRIGVSGWTYAPWRGHFYPKGLTQARELSYAARQFPALEINGTFYGLQRPEVFKRWAQATPAMASSARRFSSAGHRRRRTISSSR